MHRIHEWCLTGAATVALAAIFGCLYAHSTIAQTPTAEQLKAFENLPPAQRDAILQQLGSGSTKSTSGGTPNAADAQIVIQQPGVAGPEARDATQRVSDAQRERVGRITGGEQVLVEVVLPALPAGSPPRTIDVENSLAELRRLLLKGNPYELSTTGTLQLPGLKPIPLGGLTPKEAQQRLALDPALREFTVALTVLRIDAQGAKALKPFGYDIFRDASTALVPGTDIPVPDDYRLGPGDTMNVQLYGQQSRTYALPVGRDGTVNFPELGPIDVGGMGFGSARTLLESRVRKQLIGTQARISISELRSARVLVLGDAERPGSYVVSGLSTATAALFASGGVKSIGSLRNVEIRRAGSLVRKLDLYDVLLRGNTANDVRLQSGDVVFVPPIGLTAAVDGAVHRPAIYELANERTVGDLIALAGGLSPTADASVATLERVDGGHGKRMLALDVSSPAGSSIALENGDILRVNSIRPIVDNGILVEGHVYRPGVYAYHPGIRLSDILGSSDDLKPRADLNYVLIRREDPASKRVSVFSADLAAAVAARGSGADIALSPRDRIDVFDLNSTRDQVVQPLLEEINRQARPTDPMSVVEISGRVNAPGRYPLESGMRVTDLLRAGGGLQDAAYALKAELSRYEVVGGERRQSVLTVIDLAAVSRGDVGANVPLLPYDSLTIQETPEWGRAENITIRGEVRFPGTYRIRRGETLRSALARAGGLTSLAFAEGAVFTRAELKAREREQVERLADRLQADLAALSLQASQTQPSAGESLTAGHALLEQLRAAKPVGRLVIDIKRILAANGGSDGDVTLRGGDELSVPRATQEVTVLGEVQNPTSHLFRAGMRRDDLIDLSGGLTRRADRAHVYVVRADGSVVATPSRWFGSRSTEVHAGDTVVVPLDAEKMRPLPLWTAVTTIIYNLAIAATAIARL